MSSHRVRHAQLSVEIKATPTALPARDEWTRRAKSLEDRIADLERENAALRQMAGISGVTLVKGDNN